MSKKQVRTPNYRIFVRDKEGKLKDITFSRNNPIPLELLVGANVGKFIALHLARVLEKDWVWNETYPKKVIMMIAKLVTEAITID